MRRFRNSVRLACAMACWCAIFGSPALAQRDGAVVLPAVGDRVRVTLNNGTRLEGDFVREDVEFVVLTIAGVETSIDNLQVVRLEVVGDDFEQYVELRKQIRDDDVTRLISLVHWLAERQMYDEALAELDGIQKQEPFNGDARALRKTLAQLKALKDKRTAPSPAPGAKPTATPKQEPERRRLTARDFGLLSPSEINLIKVYEIDLDESPNLIIKRNVIDRFLQDYAEHPLVPVTRDGREAFRRKPAADILSIMFQVGARDLYGDVEVVGQPASMAMFRDDVHAGWLVNRCGTTQCHGGADAGKLMLINRRPRSEETVYTNFLILDRFRTSMGAPMIAYEAPERSALMQMGLPQADALYQHPKVRGWRPVFRSREDEGYQRAIEWIRSMYRPHPAYPIEYVPPGERRADDPKALEGPLEPSGAEPSATEGER
ncbi:MAG: hypothetical protein KDA20_03080 [Phycisphaerales bacterium]|nr:hypothetical protein [Phycisphaerales bacterium]